MSYEYDNKFVFYDANLNVLGVKVENSFNNLEWWLSSKKPTLDIENTKLILFLATTNPFVDANRFANQAPYSSVDRPACGNLYYAFCYIKLLTQYNRTCENGLLYSFLLQYVLRNN